MEDEEKITLDRESFRALTSETRTGILKSLAERRKTLSELSKELGMSVSTVKEHLDILCSAELIAQKDEGHKWKYYELTRKGRSILNPGERKIIVLLGISLLAMAATAWDMLSGYATVQMKEGYASPAAAGNLLGAETAASQIAVHLPYLHIAGIAIFAAVFIFCLFCFFRKKRNKFPD